MSITWHAKPFEEWLGGNIWSKLLHFWFKTWFRDGDSGNGQYINQSLSCTVWIILDSSPSVQILAWSPLTVRFGILSTLDSGISCLSSQCPLQPVVIAGRSFQWRANVSTGKTTCVHWQVLANMVCLYSRCRDMGHRYYSQLIGFAPVAWVRRNIQKKAWSRLKLYTMSVKLIRLVGLSPSRESKVSPV